ncbi:hypothetical protein [Xanthomonas sp. CFBP 8445]|uniref:hypothetical protein n=1 Tax=Xanthomonas sp. CFBP 8445 TaxID=2971236 RepID=UPI0021DF4E4E|nr:hypothetical protein [Xanthomonas sp. CFBP 8445]UYC13913.1 hypothetical protein NUG21_09355 [Xanthomonas sp. CFBP 8445]
MKRLRAVLIVAVGVVALAGMRWTIPRYDRITGPIAFCGKPGEWVHADNLVVAAGPARLARAIRFNTVGKPRVRTSGGVWLVIPVRSRVERTTGHLYGRTWVSADGRRYRASGRAEEGVAVLSSTKTLQPGLERKDLLVFELPTALAAGGGTLLLSEQGEPRLSAEAQVHYPALSVGSSIDLLDLDALHAKL